ncbi:hypothetical protein [Halomarina oriensis]|uniref:Uncharacterized protein n=1 Tax=Halomarina oriensis TaxID=671145 RepID=A0A6B0GMM0_9EURY|nr:hypothetical protein [Halomarina oriensis]MWG34729.1 hypothetical protein [Halomarina oriensis]
MSREVNELLAATDVHFRATEGASNPSRVILYWLVSGGLKVETRIHRHRNANRVQTSEFGAKGLGSKEDVCLILVSLDRSGVTREIRYKVGVFEVVLVEAPDDVPRPWDEVRCECEEWSQNQRNVMMQTEAETKCRHIHEAELYHIYRQRVSPVE